jgi:hypothetical protein
VPFLAIQLIAVALIISFPELVRSGVEARAPAASPPVELGIPAPAGSSLLDSQDYGDLFTKPPAEKRE